jgi:hypothetical protein
MAYRTVVGLKFAEFSPEALMPPNKRRGGSRAQGLTFERKVARALPMALHGPWYHYVDVNGPGICQPDLVLINDEQVIAVECKLTDTPVAVGQLRELYFPILSAVYSRPVGGIIVVKHLRRDSAQPVGFRDAVAECYGGKVIPLVHWLGTGPLI